MNEFLIRPAILSQQKDLEALQLRASLTNSGDREALLANPDANELPGDQIESGRVFVLESNQTTMGFATVLPGDDGEAELDGLFVDPVFWRQGVGRLLVEHCAEISRGSGATALRVVAHPNAERFYRACSFQLIGVAKTRFGDALSLKRLL